jgi:hypothetical protein
MSSSANGTCRSDDCGGGRLGDACSLILAQYSDVPALGGWFAGRARPARIHLVPASFSGANRGPAGRVGVVGLECLRRNVSSSSLPEDHFHRCRCSAGVGNPLGPPPALHLRQAQASGRGNGLCAGGRRGSPGSRLLARRSVARTGTKLFACRALWGVAPPYSVGVWETEIPRWPGLCPGWEGSNGPGVEVLKRAAMRG